jgi:hypothetical protein
MLKAPRLVLLALAALTTTSGSVTAVAQDPFGLGYAYLFGYGASNTSRISSFVPAPPYFALHPPVYYGKRYMRPYGDSPFASWPQLQASASYAPYPAAPHAQVLVNPYAPCCSPADQAPAEHVSPVVSKRATAAASAEPLVIDNPYFRASAAARLVATGDQNAESNVEN